MFHHIRTHGTGCYETIGPFRDLESTLIAARVRVQGSPLGVRCGSWFLASVTSPPGTTFGKPSRIERVLLLEGK